MKCTNKLILSLGVLFLIMLLGGCAKREEVEDAFDVYNTTSKYELSYTKADVDISLFSTKLCVGGTENTGEVIPDDSNVAAGVFIVNDGTISYARDIYYKKYPASTTKILTAYVALKKLDPDQMLTVSQSAIDSISADSSVCGLNPGDKISVRNLVYGLMVKSGNDAANVLAEAVSETQEDFADFLNEEAKKLGATSTHYKNAHGLHNDSHYTTVYDLYLIMSAAIQNDIFLDCLKTHEYTANYFDAAGNPVQAEWTTTNRFFSGNYEAPAGVTLIGGKTGTTNAAGYCLVLLSENQNGSPVISIVMKEKDYDGLYNTQSQLLSGFAN